MYYIWDNGERYSDHHVAFIQSDLPRFAVLAALNSLNEGNARVVGISAEIDWCGITPQGIEEILQPQDFYVWGDDLQRPPGPLWELTAPILLQRLVQAWKQPEDWEDTREDYDRFIRDCATLGIVRE